jgi:hypothetical protein
LRKPRRIAVRTQFIDRRKGNEEERERKKKGPGAVLVVLFLSKGLHPVAVNFTWRREATKEYAWLAVGLWPVASSVSCGCSCRHIHTVRIYAAQVSSRPYKKTRLAICMY